MTSKVPSNPILRIRIKWFYVGQLWKANHCSPAHLAAPDWRKPGSLRQPRTMGVVVPPLEGTPLGGARAGASLGPTRSPCPDKEAFLGLLPPRRLKYLRANCAAAALKSNAAASSPWPYQTSSFPDGERASGSSREPGENVPPLYGRNRAARGLVLPDCASAGKGAWPARLHARPPARLRALLRTEGKAPKAPKGPRELLPSGSGRAGSDPVVCPFRRRDYSSQDS